MIGEVLIFLSRMLWKCLIMCLTIFSITLLTIFVAQFTLLPVRGLLDLVL